MKQLYTNLFPSPTFSLDQYRNVGFGNPFYFVAYGLHSRGFAEENVHRWQTKGGSGFGIMNQVIFPSCWVVDAMSAIRFTQHVARQLI